MKWALIFWIFIFVQEIYGQERGVFPSHQPFFILEVKKSGSQEFSLVLETAKHRDSFHYSFSTDSPLPGIFFKNDPRFRLAHASVDPLHAVYFISKIGLELEPFSDFSAEQIQSFDKRRRLHMFGQLEDTLPIRRHEHSPEKLTANISSCPDHPKRANGEPCLFRIAKILPDRIWKKIEKAAEPHEHFDAPFLAAIVELETRFDPLMENVVEKKICLTGKEPCSPYRWGRGLGQFGASEANVLQFVWEDKDWEDQLESQITGCKTGPYNFKLSSRCLDALEKACKKRPEHIFCIDTALSAIAKKLAQVLPANFKIWQHENISRVKALDVKPQSLLDRLNYLRVLSGAYNRGVRVQNSWENFYNSQKRHPRNYGELWTSPRSETTPPPHIGYSILRGEYINRCYVWRMAGLCGKLQDTTVLAQLQKQYTAYRNKIESD